MPGSVNINIPPRLIESARAAQYANREALDSRSLSSKIKANAKARSTAVVSAQESATKTTGEFPDFRRSDYWRIWRRRRRGVGNLLLNKLDTYGLNAWETDGISAGIACEWSTESNDFTVFFQHDLQFMEERPPAVNQSSAPYDTKAFTAASLKDGVYTFAMVSMETVAKTDTTLNGARSFQKFKKVISHATYPEGGQADQEFLEIMLATAALSETNSLNPVLNTTATYYDFPASQDWIPFGQVVEQQTGPKPDYWPTGNYNPIGWNTFVITATGLDVIPLSTGPGFQILTSTYQGFVVGFGDARITIFEVEPFFNPALGLATLWFETNVQARPFVGGQGFDFNAQERFIDGTRGMIPPVSYSATVFTVGGAPGIPYPTWEEYSGPRTPKYPSARFENLFAYENYVANTAYFGLRYPQDPIDGIFNQE
jgi:hypothetical protein